MLFAHCLYVVCTVAPPTSEPELQLLHSSKISAAVKLFRHHVQTSLHSSSAFLSHVFNTDVLFVLQSEKNSIPLQIFTSVLKSFQHLLNCS